MVIYSPEEQACRNETWFEGLQTLRNTERTAYSISMQHLLLPALHQYKSSCLIISYQMNVGEGQTLPALCRQNTVGLQPICHLLLDVGQKSAGSLTERARALLACHLISFGYFQLKEKQRKETDRGQSNYIHLYTPSCLISSAWEGESREGEDETDESLPEAWDLLCFRQGFRSGSLPVHKVSHNHEDTLIQPGLSHGTPTSGSSRYEM